MRLHPVFLRHVPASCVVAEVLFRLSGTVRAEVPWNGTWAGTSQTTCGEVRLRQDRRQVWGDCADQRGDIEGRPTPDGATVRGTFLRRARKERRMAHARGATSPGPVLGSAPDQTGYRFDGRHFLTAQVRARKRALASRCRVPRRHVTGTTPLPQGPGCRTDIVEPRTRGIARLHGAPALRRRVVDSAGQRTARGTVTQG